MRPEEIKDAIKAIDAILNGSPFRVSGSFLLVNNPYYVSGAQNRESPALWIDLLKLTIILKRELETLKP